MNLSNADLIRSIYTKKKYIAIKNETVTFTDKINDNCEMIDLCEPLVFELQNLLQSISYVWSTNRYHDNKLESFLRKKYGITLRQYKILKNFLES